MAGKICKTAEKQTASSQPDSRPKANRKTHTKINPNSSNDSGALLGSLAKQPPKPQHSTPLHLSRTKACSGCWLTSRCSLRAQAPAGWSARKNKKHTRQTLTFRTDSCLQLGPTAASRDKRRGGWKPIQNTLRPSSGQKKKTKGATLKPTTRGGWYWQENVF